MEARLLKHHGLKQQHLTKRYLRRKESTLTSLQQHLLSLHHQKTIA